LPQQRRRAYRGWREFSGLPPLFWRLTAAMTFRGIGTFVLPFEAYYLAGERLAATETAATVRCWDGGDVMVARGRFAQTREQITGVLIVDCKDIDEAIEVATRNPGSLVRHSRGETDPRDVTSGCRGSPLVCAQPGRGQRSAGTSYQFFAGSRLTGFSSSLGARWQCRIRNDGLGLIADPLGRWGTGRSGIRPGDA
jgi:hypothetical protein